MDADARDDSALGGRPSLKLILLCGPSGSGKSTLADHSGLPVLRLDDFYRSGNDPALPRSPLGIPDWDDPRSWDTDAALAVIARLCRTGCADVPVYDIAQDGVIGHRRLDARGARAVVGEGIFAATLIGPCRDDGLLMGAMCIRHHRGVTFIRRLLRDLREQRKPPLVLVRRGFALLRAEPELIRAAIASGCELVTAREAAMRLREVADSARIA